MPSDTVRWLALSALFALAGCRAPRPSYALVVRDPLSKCALIRFSGCASLLPPSYVDADAGAEDDAGTTE